MTVPPHLSTLLPEPPARILALGWDGCDREPGEAGREMSYAASLADLDRDSGSFEAILWNGDSAAEAAEQETVTAAEIAWVHDHLIEHGRVVVVAPLAKNAPKLSKRRGTLPARHQTRLRAIVRALSEAGFVIRRDDETRPPGEGTAGWKIMVATRDPFVIRPYEAGDEEAILRLFRTCFHLDRSLDHWHWKYAANPYGACKISLARSGAGDLAAHYGGYPVPFWHQDEGGKGTFLALHMGDTMTDDAFRHAGRGKSSLLARTVRHFFSVHRDGSFGIFYGFNTGPIQRFCRWFIGGSQTIPVGYRVRELAPAPGWSLAGGYRIERVDTVTRAWDRFFRRVAPSYGFLVQRDAKYLDWRYLQCPESQHLIFAVRHWGRLVGWSVFRRRDDAIEWGDALFERRHAAAAEPLLAHALSEPELAGAKRVEAWFPEEPSWWSERVADLGFASPAEPRGLGMVALADVEPAAFARLGKLYYTMGDGDLF